MVQKKKRRLKRILIVVAVIIIVFLIGCGVYVSDYYHADTDAFQALESDDQITVQHPEKNLISFEPENATTGLIFYPGGKVETESYAPLMRACAEKGILCVLVEMPFHLAVFDVNAAEGIQELYPEIENWYIGGHSLGGSMAASYLGKHATDYEGLVLLASYSTADLSGTELDVLSIYGSEDGVLNMESYEKYKENLPDTLTEQIIDGGCHAYFGNYGAQDGDGTPEITRKEQTEITVSQIVDLMDKK